jgi:hypothetical protein
LSSQQLSLRAAIRVGILIMALGVAPILGALEIIPMPLTPGTPAWVGVCAGLVFILAGAAVINGYAFPPADLKVRTTTESRRSGLAAKADGHYRYHLQNILGLVICAIFAAISGWIAFGPGERQFSSSISLPFYTSEGRGGEWIGRAAFGISTLMCIVFVVVILVRSLRNTK